MTIDHIRWKYKQMNDTSQSLRPRMRDLKGDYCNDQKNSEALCEKSFWGIAQIAIQQSTSQTPPPTPP